MASSWGFFCVCSPLEFFYLLSSSSFASLRSVFIVSKSLRMWKQSFNQTHSLFWSLNLIKNQIWKRITIIILKTRIILKIEIILKIRIEWQKYIEVRSFHASWQITLFIKNKSLIFNFTF
jgi:hypothetical protein